LETTPLRPGVRSACELDKNMAKADKSIIKERRHYWEEKEHMKIAVNSREETNR
jgi:hypothetical protein